MSKLLVKTTILSLILVFAVPIVVMPAMAVEKTDSAKKKAKKKSPCGKEECMKAAPSK